jgi:tetratricopeptide (TPR) repeat protein
VPPESPHRAAPGEPSTGALPESDNPFFETPITVVSSGEVLNLEDLPDVISAGTFDGGLAPTSGSYAALVATDQSAPGIFDRDPPPEEPPLFSTEETLREMGAEPWTQNIDGLIALGSAGKSVAPTRAYWETLERILLGERSGERDLRRLFALSLAVARVAARLDRPKEAVGYVEAALAVDGSSPAAHRALLLLAEQTGRMDDEGAAESLARLALTSHADQPYYRALHAEWILSRALRGIVDGTAAAAITAVPDGLARMLAEAEISWREPPVAAAILESAALRVGGGLGAALMECAAGLNDTVGDFQSAAERRFVAARLDDSRATVSLGVLADLARLDAKSVVPALGDLIARFPTSPLKVSLARWGASAACRNGDRSGAWRFVSDGIALGPSTAGLARDRLDLWPRSPESPNETLRAISLAPLFTTASEFWGSATPGIVLAIRACELATSSSDVDGALAAAEKAVAGVSHGEIVCALAPAVEDLARRSEDRIIGVHGLRLWRRIDQARWTSASLELADALVPTPQMGPVASGPDSTESVLGEIAARDPTSPVFWALATLAARRGRFADAAAHIDQGLERAAWRKSTLAAPLGELAAELLARSDKAAGAGRLSAARTTASRTQAQRQTLARILRQLGDRDLWAEFVEDEISGVSLDPQLQRGRAERANLLLEPVFWRTDAGEGEDVPSLVALVLDTVPLHPVALGLALAERPDPALLVDRFAAGRPGVGGDLWAVVAAVAASLSGDAPRALQLAVDARAGRGDPSIGAVATRVLGAARAIARRMFWAVPHQAERARIIRELADPDAPVDVLIEAGESAAESGDRAEARRLFEAATVAMGQAPVDSDIRWGLAGLSPFSSHEAWPLSAVDTSADGPTFGGTSDRLPALARAVSAGRWDDVVGLLATHPPHEESPGADSCAIAAAIDAGRCQGHRVRELWARARAALVGTPPVADVSPEGTFRPAPWLWVADPLDAEPADTVVALQELAGLASRAPDQRSVALFLLEAAQVLAPRPDVEAATLRDRCLRSAVTADPASAAAAMAWRRWLASAGRVDEAASASAAEAEAWMDPTLRVQALLRAAALLVPGHAATVIGDAVEAVDVERVNQAAGFLRRALEIAPHDHDAFTRLRDLYEESGRPADLARLLGARVEVTSNPFEVTALLLARADLLAGPLGDRASAKGELEAILRKEPRHARALARLADLEEEDGHAAAAAELLVRRAFIERSPEKLRDLFLRLGRIYTRIVPDPKRAVGAYARVLQLDANNREALDELSRLYLGLGETKSAIAITERLVRIETAPGLRSRYHVRLAQLAERAGDPRAAALHFRRAAEEAPRDIEALGELVRHLERTRDSAGRRTVLDRAGVDLRAMVRANPSDRSAVDALVAVLRWRGRAAAAAAAAELSELVTAWSAPGVSDDSESFDLPAWAVPPIGGRRLAALAKPSNDEQTFPAAVPPSVRHLFRLLAPVLWEGKTDVSRHGVDRGDRVPSGRPPRDIFDVVAAELAAGPFDLYVARGRDGVHRVPLAVEPGKPPAIIIGAELIKMGNPALRFAAGRALRLTSTHLDVALAGDRTDLGAWLTAVVRQFVSDYRHPDVPQEVTAARAARVARLMPRKLRQEIMPFAMESSGALDLDALIGGIRDGANRVGLLASGSLGAALRVLQATSSVVGQSGGTRARLSELFDNAEAKALLVFALSDEYDDLVKALE